MRKRILFIESRYQTFYGAQKSMAAFIKALDTEYFESKVVLAGKGKLEDELKKLNIDVDVIKLGKKADAFGGKILNYSVASKIIVLVQIFIFNLRLIPYIVKNKIDAVYANDFRALFYVVVASKLLRKKIILYIRTDITYNLFTKAGIFLSDYIITIAKGVLKNLPQNVTDKYDKKTYKIYTGFEFDKFSIMPKEQSKMLLDIDSKEIVIGFVGSINERKGLDLLIAAIYEMCKSCNNITLLIAGDITSGSEGYWKNLKNIIQKNNLKVKHVGYFTEMNLIYSAIDILVLPSRMEGLPRVIIEGMAHGLPVIASDVGGVKEIIQDESLGLIIPADSITSLIKALSELIYSEDIRAKMASTAKVYVKEKFSEEKFKKSINELLMNI
ncbi:MAG: glycosyltransferase family 4 protein [Lutispora sp.]|nr:glycosyltransferase family 4 protein [Lutispora sp.]MDD4835056.1 glycosyltransferase family 4 protein [Lutispora sp.]